MGRAGVFVKRRGVPAAGSIPEALDMFRAEVRFYREVAPVVGVRVPVCYRAEEGPEGTVLELEDLSGWSSATDPVEVAGALAGLHRRWKGRALERWPWLRRPGAAAALIGRAFDEAWPNVAERPECPPRVRELGARLVGRVPGLVEAVGDLGTSTLVHGDAALGNVLVGPGGELAFVDWEDVGAAPGVCDLAWLLVSSTEPDRCDDVVEAYGPVAGLGPAVLEAASQGILSVASVSEPDEVAGWMRRLEAAARLASGT